MGEVGLFSPDLQLTGPQQGMVIDYYIIGLALSKMVEEHLDHYFLNDSLKHDNPTSEHIAKWCYEWLSQWDYGDQAAFLKPYMNYVRIKETCTTSCTYTRAVMAFKNEWQPAFGVATEDSKPFDGTFPNAKREVKLTTPTPPGSE